MWARIESNTVIEVTSADPVGRFHSSMIWVKCPEGTESGWELQDGAFGLPAVSLTDLHAFRLELINQQCESYITGGFRSSALGAPYLYSSQIEDQINLAGVIIAGVDVAYACFDEANVKDFRLHTYQQIREVGDAFTSFKLGLLQKANTLKQQLDAALAAGDLAALEAVTWESEQ